MNGLIYMTAEALICAGSDMARNVAETGNGAERDACRLLVEAAESTDEHVSAPHTRDVLEMIGDGYSDAALSMHLAFATAEMEHGPSGAMLLDNFLAGEVLRADQWRREHQLPLVLGELVA